MDRPTRLASSTTWPDLARLRYSRNLPLNQIAAATKISPQYLRAIEAGKFEELPGGVFNTSYIRQYARAIDFDEEDLVWRYRLLAGDAGSAIDPAPRARQLSLRDLGLLLARLLG